MQTELHVNGALEVGHTMEALNVGEHSFPAMVANACDDAQPPRCRHIFHDLKMCPEGAPEDKNEHIKWGRCFHTWHKVHRPDEVKGFGNGKEDSPLVHELDDYVENLL